MASKICIAIAVSKPDGLDEIPGAIPSAKRLATWANEQGYGCRLVTDENEAVTCQRLNAVFKEVLGGGGQQRILVTFAGHGLIRGGAEEYWLLNDWRTRATEAVNHLKLRDRLGTYLPKQLAIVSDACRSLPTERAKWVEGNGVVDVMDYVEQPAQFANLSGTMSAQPAYATPLGTEQAYCFFTETLVNALRGSFSRHVTEADGNLVITNDGLYNAVAEELPLLASRHDRNQFPDLQGGWRSPPGAIWSTLGRPGAALPAPRDPSPSARRGDVSEDEEAAVAPDNRAQEYERRLRTQNRATHFETGTGLVFSNDRGPPLVHSVSIGRHFEAMRDQFSNWFRLIPKRGDAASFVAEIDGWWVGGCAYRDFIASYGISTDGSESCILRPAYEDAPLSEETVARAATGQVLADPFDLAARLRDQKHTNPVLGALAAYAYSRAGAIDDIRRLVYFYAKHQQPAPFDAVLLARAPIVAGEHGFVCEVPAVEARDPLNDAERARAWTHQATPSAVISVGGSFPWLRQGWSLLEDDFRPEFRSLARLARGLLPSLFTAFDFHTGREVADRLAAGDLR
ncbi:hypothetical protein JQ543_23490 [Bradyrhizobium diazoefficiens]|nr:hypothetical protein [Bradyrhizobium diazoefficiens]MBR0850725.1 hypothetical protein [Bradyrhizobium diazoefficiens]